MQKGRQQPEKGFRPRGCIAGRTYCTDDTLCSIVRPFCPIRLVVAATAALYRRRSSGSPVVLAAHFSLVSSSVMAPVNETSLLSAVETRLVVTQANLNDFFVTISAILVFCMLHSLLNTLHSTTLIRCLFIKLLSI